MLIVVCVQFNYKFETKYWDLETEEARSGVGCESMSKCQEICHMKLMRILQNFALSYNHPDQ